MNSAFKRWIHPGQIRYSRCEWMIMRIGLACLIYYSLRLGGYDALNWAGSAGRGVEFGTQPNPRSIAQFMDLTWITKPENIPYFCMTAAVFLMLLILGRLLVVASLGLATLQTLIGALENSQGHNVWHTSQILVLGLLGIAIGSIGNLGRRFWTIQETDSEDERETKERSLMIYLTQQLMAMAYVVSGISKMWISKGRWSLEVADIGLQFEKNRLFEYHETLQTSQNFPWAVEIVNAYPTFTSIFFSIGLALELFCFVALFNRGFMLLAGLSLLAMHLAISQLMSLDFIFNEWMLVIFFINLPYWILVPWTNRNRSIA